MTQRMHPYSPGRRKQPGSMADLIPQAEKLAEESEAYKTGTKHERSNMNCRKRPGGNKRWLKEQAK